MEVELIGGTLPTRGSNEAAGYDLYAAENGGFSHNSRQLIATGIKIKLPEGTYGQIYARSGLAYKKGIQVMAGVIDSDYRGEVKVLLYNSGDEPFEYKKGDRIAQLIIHKIVQEDPIVVDSLDGSDRGAGGFGSTGR